MTGTQISSEAGCLGAFVSVAVASLLITMAQYPFGGGAIGLYIIVFTVTAIIFVMIGLPLYLVARRFHSENLWTAMACGAATGAALPLITAISDGVPHQWIEAAGFALVGTVSGIAFFLTATASRDCARNITILIAMVGFSAALTPAIWAVLGS